MFEPIPHHFEPDAKDPGWMIGNNGVRVQGGHWTTRANLDALESELTALKEQRSRIIEAESHRNKILRGGKAWHPVVWNDRPDCLAWRLNNEGQSELLMYNNALGDPFYVATGSVPEDAKEASLQSAQEALQDAKGLLKEWRNDHKLDNGCDKECEGAFGTHCDSRCALCKRTDAILAPKER